MTLIPYSKTSTSRLSYPLRYQHAVDGNVIASEEFSTQVNFIDSFNGFKQPGWRDLIKKHLSATTIASGTKSKIQAPYVSGYARWVDPPTGVPFLVTYTGVPTNEYIGTAQYDYSYDDEIRNSALVAFLKKCKNAQRHFQSGVFIGEIRETLHLIRKPALALRELTSSYVQKVRIGAHRYNRREQLRLLSNQWLEYSFGAKPLIHDVSDAAKALASLQFDFPTSTVKAFAAREYSQQSFVTKIPIAGGRIHYNVDGKRVQLGRRDIKGVVRLSTSGDPNRLRTVIGARLPDFIPTIYELIPYSFLVDYFTNIGEILEAYSFSRADLIWVCDTWHRNVTQTLIGNGVTPNLIAGTSVLADWSIPQCTSVYEVKSFTRGFELNESPTLAFKIPGLGVQALNIAALTHLRVLR
jgi:hypothetical protein